jgi:SAM-dependent methyltransferase
VFNALATSFKDHFSDRASTYAANRPTYPPELVDYFASIAPARALAWDCGCGSGQLSVPLAAGFRHVIATDASADQIANAIAHPRIEYRAAPAEASGIEGASVDFIVAAQAAHWFDLPKFYAEVRRVARDHAVVALLTYDLLEVNDRIDGLVRAFYRSLPWPPERKLVDERYATIDFPFEELSAPEFFIRNEWTANDLIGYVHTWSGLRGVDASPFENEIRAAWGEPTRAVKWPIAMRIGKVK